MLPPQTIALIPTPIPGFIAEEGRYSSYLPAGASCGAYSTSDLADAAMLSASRPTSFRMSG